jgi:hypothetical protein
VAERQHLRGEEAHGAREKELRAMSEILSGARYTFGGLVVLTLWSLVAVQVVEWRLDNAVEQVEAEAEARASRSDEVLMRLGPDIDSNASTVRRYNELMKSAGME